MPYIHFTEEQKRRASSVDLPEFLRRQGEKLLRSGREYRMASDRSVTIRGNEWYDHETGQGGGPISFLQTRCGLSYPEAVSRLLEEQVPVVQTYQKPEEEQRKPFVPPSANREMPCMASVPYVTVREGSARFIESAMDAMRCSSAVGGTTIVVADVSITGSLS